MPSVISAADVQNAAASGERTLVVDDDAVISPLAADRARDLGIEIRRAATAPRTGQRGVDDVVRSTLRDVLEEVGDDDLREVVRRTLARLRAGTDRGRARRGSRDPSRPLLGSTAVITGASSGIGQATAIALAEAGARIAVGTYADDPHDINATVSAVESGGGEVIVTDADVRLQDQVDRLCDAAVERWGGLDIAIANAAVLSRDAFEELSDERWQAILDVDLHGAMRTCRSAAQRMNEQGSIVCVSSIAGAVFGWSEHAHYATAKAGMIGLVRSLAVELGPRGIRVNAVLPGLIETPQSLDPQASVGGSGLRAAAGSVPLRRIGEADEVATAVRFLASDDASYINGHSLVVDGGISVGLSV